MSFRNSSGISSSQSSQNFTAQFCITSRFHLTPLTMKILADSLFSLFSTITLVSLVNSTLLRLSFTLELCPDTCRRLKFPSIFFLCQEEATREPCLQPLGLLPIQLLMTMSLLQLRAAIFSVLIATPDSTVCWRCFLSWNSRFSWNSPP